MAIHEEPYIKFEEGPDAEKFKPSLGPLCGHHCGKITVGIVDTQVHHCGCAECHGTPDGA